MSKRFQIEISDGGQIGANTGGRKGETEAMGCSLELIAVPGEGKIETAGAISVAMSNPP